MGEESKWRGEEQQQQQQQQRPLREAGKSGDKGGSRRLVLIKGQSYSLLLLPPYMYFINKTKYRIGFSVIS